ncbi:MAG: YoaP domain-containing protein [Firmicutes bacterium]|nr:YoaP domain-containing protein [Bacillota bacterium]
MDLIKLTHENLDKEHICCAISNNKDIQVSSKKAWLKDRLDEGLVFLKGDVRGKCFIEYIPAEYAWAPLDAKEYMYIDCLWVSGQFKGHGYSNQLLNECIRDSGEKGKKGICVLSSEKKAGFLSDPKYLRYKGFKLADTAKPYFELYYFPLSQDAEIPHFKPCVNEVHNEPDGFTLYYTNQCPFTAKYVPLLEQTAQEHAVKLNTIHIATREQAQKASCPFTTFALYYGGKFITHEIQSVSKFEKIIAEYA